MNPGDSYIFQGSISCPNCGNAQSWNIEFDSNIPSPAAFTNPITTSQLNWNAQQAGTNVTILAFQTWPQSGGSINFDILVQMPSTTSCGTIFTCNVKATNATSNGTETDIFTFTVLRAMPIIQLGLPFCANSASCTILFGATFSNIQYSMSATGWTINGNTLPWTTTSSNTSVTLTKPNGFSGSATLTVTINGCSTSQTFWVGTVAAPSSLVYDQWIGHNCYSWVDWANVPGAINYQYQIGAGTGTTYGSIITTTNSNTDTGWAPGFTFHIRVRSVNNCGTSAWKVLQGTTPTNPTYPNCNGN